MLTKVIGGALALAVVALLGYLAFDQVRTSSANTVPDGVASYNYAGGQHDDNFNSWTESPPVGGYHNNVWQNCAYYDTSVPSGRAVHSLEHGAVWITYKSDLPQDQKDKLKKLTDGDQFLLVSQYDNQDSPIVVTAWNKQLKVDSADSKDIKRFINAFENTRKNTPEYGARCSGGSSATS
jgi:hypothetical protein